MLLGPLPGTDGTDPLRLAHPEQLVRMLATALRQLHDLPPSACPFDCRLPTAMAHVETRRRCGQIDTTKLPVEYAHHTAETAVRALRRDLPAAEDLVITHGDYCVPNIVFDGDRLSGFVDVGALGVADRWRDLAVATWSIERNIGYGSEDLFLSIHGAEPDPARMLWLEDVSDMHGRRWPLAQFGLAARHLGVFNGTYLVSRPLPAEPWFNYSLARHLAAVAHGDEFESDSDIWAELELSPHRPAAERVFGAAIARTAQLWRDQAHFVGLLARLPQTLCHHESSLANLFAVDRGHGLVETVAVDWEQIGPGPVGAEIATLVFGTLRRCEFDAERAIELDQVVFAAYVDGLREAGWRGPVEHVRLGYTAALALRWSVLVSTLRLLVEGAQPVRTSQGWRVSPEANLRQLVLTCQYMLDRADEARRLPVS